MSLDKTKLKEALSEYKEAFPKRWKNTKYKWEAIKTFQAHWNIESENFAKMLEDSLPGNEVSDLFSLSRKAVASFAKNSPDETRAMFRSLFDDKRDFIERIEDFRREAKKLSRNEEVQKEQKRDQQLDGTATIYLWLHDPDKYCIYKPAAAKALAKRIGYNYDFPTSKKREVRAENLKKFTELYEEICNCIKEDTELTELVDKYCTAANYYPDKERKTLASDFGYYIKDVTIPDPPKFDGYWWLVANPDIWKLAKLPVGATKSYELVNPETKQKLHVPRNFIAAKTGDKVIGYVSGKDRKIVSLCEVAAEQDGEKIVFRKLKNIPSPISYATLKKTKGLENMEFFRTRGTLFRLTKEEYDCIMKKIESGDDTEGTSGTGVITFELYDDKKFLEEVFISQDQLKDLRNILITKKNIILKGAPGVGKTYAAERLAYVMMGKKDKSKIKFIQFHQNYSYEDFLMGYKPSGTGFELTKGIFYEFCKHAADHSEDGDFFLIIDEINRGNMSKIFGELLMMIEDEYRGKDVILAYNKEPFAIPTNLYIIGMMNTADRSIAMLDYALRRRFSHFELEPAFGSEEFNKWLEKYGNGKDNKEVQSFIGNIIELNKAITKSLGKGFCIGHSYFCKMKKYLPEDLKLIREYEILPALEEYWFDDPKNLDDWTKVLRGEKTVSDIKKKKKKEDNNDADSEEIDEDGE